jgi:HK97 family phage prohead protease
MRRLYSIEQFAKLDKPLQRDSEVSIATCSMEDPEFVDGGRVVNYTFSTPAVGRDNHTVAPDAWMLQNYLRNPVFLWAHDDTLPPIGRVIDIGNVNGKLKGSVEYATRELNPFADTIYQLVRAKYLNAVSTSWQPLEWDFSSDRKRPKGIDFEKVDLLEISQVPIPALPEALAEARSRGIDTGPLREWAERMLDTGGMIIVPRAELETLRRAAKMSKTTRSQPKAEDTLKAKHERALRRAPKIPVFKRGLYDVANLCHMLCQIGYAHESSEYEAALEGDDSEVPEMLGEALVQLGEALKAMAEEEVNELLEAHDPGDDDDGDEEELVRSLPAKTRAFIAAAKSPRARAWRTGIALARAGHELSPTNEDHLESASEHQDRAMKHHKDMGDSHGAAAEHLATAEDSHERATSTLSELGEHVRAAKANPAESADHLEKASKSHADATKYLEAVGDAHGEVADSHEDSADSHRAMGRCVKNAQRCVRSVIKSADTTEGDEPDADDLEDDEKAKEEKARKARLARAAALKAATV